MPFIVGQPKVPIPVIQRGRSTGAARPGALESLLVVNGLTLNDQLAPERYFIKSVDGLFGADIRDQREPKVGQDGEDVYDTLLGGKTVTISGRIEAWTSDSMRDMEQELEAAFPHNFDYPIVFDRGQLRAAGIAKGATADHNWSTNPNVDSASTGWSIFGTNALLRQTGYYSRLGTHHAEITVNNNVNLVRVDTNVAVDALDYYQVAIDVFIPSDWSGGQISISDGALNGGTPTLVTAQSSRDADMTMVNRWQRIWATYQRDNTAGTTAHLLVFTNALPVAGSKIRFSGVSIRKGGAALAGPPTYFDGDSSGWKWSGVPYLSDSQPDLTAYRQDVFIMGRRIDKIGLRDEQTSGRFHREFQIPFRMADPCIYSTLTRTVSSVAGSLTTLYAKNHGNYMASPRLRIMGPWTNFAIENSVLLDGETDNRRFSMIGSIPGGGYFDWVEDDGSLTDNTGTRRDGMVDSSANGLRLGRGTSVLGLSGTGLTAQSQVFVYYEDSWK